MDLSQEYFTRLNFKESARGKYVLYWMQQSQRAHDNSALTYAITRANRIQLPLVVLFVVTDDFLEANLRHYQFMLEGIYETMCELTRLEIHFMLVVGNMVQSVITSSINASVLITDQGYLRAQRNWRSEIAARIDCEMVTVEGDVVFPVEKVMDSEAYNARSIRSRLYKLLPNQNIYPISMPAVQVTLQQSWQGSILKAVPKALAFTKENTSSQTDFVNQIKVLMAKPDNSVLPVTFFHGGYSEAMQHLTYFIDNFLNRYLESRSNPGTDCQSRLSPYLHFGQISIREILHQVLIALGLTSEEFLHLVLTVKPGNHADSRINGALVLFEEAVIRRELSMNYCWYNEHYDSYSALPGWALATLKAHTADVRKWVYSLNSLEQAETHDAYWNAAQQEMCLTGKMHGYMRMYWGKKLIEWCREPEEAYRIALYLNNKYELDGRDPNAYAGVAWCFGKHDRPWTSFPVLGNVRTMTDAGLKRKFDMQDYLNRIGRL